MASMENLVSRVRSELSDLPKSFLQTIQPTGDTSVYELTHAPVKAATVVVHVGGTDITDNPWSQPQSRAAEWSIEHPPEEDWDGWHGLGTLAVQVEEHTGKLHFNQVIPADPALSITVAGTCFRFFTDRELEEIVTNALQIHAGSRTTVSGSPLTITSLPPEEEYPMSLLACVQALHILSTDASFDIDIYAPDGVNIPRSQRYRQLTEQIDVLSNRYKELSQLMGIGLYSIEVYTLRRISKRTNRYVPVYRPQEFDDRSKAERLYFPMPTYGADVLVDSTPVLDLEVKQGDTYTKLVDLPLDVPESAVLKAQIRDYPGSQILVGEFDVHVVDKTAIENRTKIMLYMRSGYNQMNNVVAPGQINPPVTDGSVKRFGTSNLPLRAVWDLQMTVGDEVTTLLRGRVHSPRQVTT